MNYEYNYSYGTPSTVAGGIFAGLGIIWFISMAVCVFLLVCMYKVFKKAGRNGWEALIPIYNIIVMIQIAELPMWYIALFFIPFANIYAMFKIYIEFAHKFGKSTGFGIAMIFFSYICLPILAFGDAKYNGSVPINTNYNQNSISNNGMQQINMQTAYNQNTVMNNDIQNNGLNATQNNLGQPEVQPTPMVTPETPAVNSTPEVQPIPVIVPESPIVNETPEVVQVPTPQVEPVTPVESLQPVVEASVTPVVETEQQSQGVEPVVIEPTTSEPVNNEIPNDKKFCPKCGNQVDKNDAICFMCGNQF